MTTLQPEPASPVAAAPAGAPPRPTDQLPDQPSGQVTDHVADQTAVAPAPAAHPEPQAGTATAARVWVLVRAVGAPVLASYLATVAVLFLVAAPAGAEVSAGGLLAASAAVWPAVHQVPLDLTTGGSTAPLGVLPLLPTAGLAVLVAGSAGWATRRLGYSTAGQLGRLTAVFGAGHGLLGLGAAVVRPAGAVAVPPVVALFGCAALAACCAAAGGLLAAGAARLAATVVPGWAMHGVRAGLLGVGALLAAGTVGLLAGLVLSLPTAYELLTGSGGAGDAVGRTLLCLAYLPNAAVASASWVTGPGFTVGELSTSPFVTTGGELPAVPLLAAVPAAGDAKPRMLALVLPALAGVLVGRYCRAADGDRSERLNAAALAGAVAAAGFFALAVLAGGQLGTGPFDPVRVPPASLAVAVFIWIVVPAAAVVALARGAGGTVEMVADPEPEAAEPADEAAGDSEPDVADDEPDEPAEPGDPDPAGKVNSAGAGTGEPGAPPAP